MHSGVVFSVWFLVLAINFINADDCPPDRKEATHDEAKLHKDLFCAYSYEHRPVLDHKKTVTVKVRFSIKYLSFDSLEETVTVHSWVAMTWLDEFLHWEPSNYGDIKEIQIESHEIWTPRMALFNADATMYQSDLFYTTCAVDYKGTVTCVPHIAHTGICRTSLTRWPYDVQNCTLYFGSWMHKGEQVNFTFYNMQPVITNDFQNGPDWKLLKVANDRLPGIYSCCPNDSYPMLKYTFVLKREAAGPAAIVVVPSIVIVLLTLSSVLLDVKDNVRLILLCFSLFGHFIFLTQIGYEIPKHGADTPIILLFVRDSMIVTLTSILITLVLMSLIRRTLPAPGWMVSLNRMLASGPGKYVVFTEIASNDTSKSKLTDDDGNVNEETNRSNDWIQFSNILNSFMFIIIFLTYFVLTCLYIPYD